MSAYPCSCHADELARMLRDGVALADDAALSDIQEHALHCGNTPNGRRKYDLRPMLDPREQPAETLYMAQRAVNWARMRGLVAPADAHQPDIVVILKVPK